MLQTFLCSRPGHLQGATQNQFSNNSSVEKLRSFISGIGKYQFDFKKKIKSSSQIIVLILIFIFGVKIIPTYSACNCNGLSHTTIGSKGSTTNISSYLTNGILPTGCYVFAGTVQINTNTLIRNSEIQMVGGSEIKVLSGYRLNISSNTTNGGIHGCDTLWKGINVESGATLYAYGSYIQDAQYAIRAQGTAKVIANNNHILQNYVGVFVPHTGNGTTHDVKFTIFDNIFDNPASFGGNPGLLRYPNYIGITPDPNRRAFAGFEINNASVVIGSKLLSGQYGRNTITNTRVGVRADSSTLQCYNLLIHDMIAYTPNQFYTDPDGVGILVSYSILTSIRDTIYNAIVGISGNTSWLKDIQFNEISYIQAGIFDVISANPPNITNNDISFVQNRGIEITRPATLINPMIISNTISTDGTEPTTDNKFIGICVFQVGQWIQSAVVKSNIIDMHSNGIGIEINSGYNVATGLNVVNFNDETDVQHVGIGISHAGCRNGFIIENTVNVGENFEQITGFVSDVVANTPYCCNEVIGTNVGYSFTGACQKDNGFAHNKIRGLSSGIYCAKSTVLGIQLNRGNLWYGSFPSPTSLTGGAVHNGSFLERRMSQFWISGCSDPNWPTSNRIYPVQYCAYDPSYWFEQSDTENVRCEEDASCDILFLSPDREISFSDIGEGDEYVSRGLMNGGDYGFSLDYESRRHLYERMWLDASSHSQNTYVDSFYTATQSITIAELHAVAMEIDTLMSFTEEEQDSMESIYTQMGEIEDSLRVLDSLLTIASNGTDSTNIILLRDTSLGRMDTLTILYQDIFKAYKERVLTDKAAIIYQNSIIDPVNIIDTNEQIVNDLFLAQLMEDSFTFDYSQTLQLEGVAEQCPREGGSIVYKARGLYKMIDDVLYDDSGCIDTFMQIRSKVKTKLGSNFGFAPVPAENILTLDFSLVKDLKSFQVEILDFAGKPVFKKLFHKPFSDTFNIPIQENWSGMYTGLIKDDSSILYKQKLVFIK